MSHLQLPHRRPAHAHYLRNMAKLASRPARWPKNPRQDPACLLCALQHFLSRPLSPEPVITFARDHALLELVSALQDTLQLLFQNTNLPSDTSGVKTGEYEKTRRE